MIVLFRFLLIFSALIIGFFGLSNLLFISTAKRNDLGADTRFSAVAAPLEFGWSSYIIHSHSAAFVDRAIIHAHQILANDLEAHLPRGEFERIRSDIRQAAYLKPFDAELWLVLGMLEAKADSESTLAIDALRMSYLTGPNATDLMPARLSAVTHSDSLKNLDLRELALGDVRKMLSKRFDQRESIRSAYQRASNNGRTFLRTAIDTIDPAVLVDLGMLSTP